MLRGTWAPVLAGWPLGHGTAATLAADAAHGPGDGRFGRSGDDGGLGGRNGIMNPNARTRPKERDCPGCCHV
jgi:hypothetical protein